MSVETADLHFAGAWEQVADTLPDSVAVIAGDRQITYHQYDGLAARFAAAIEAAGVGPGAAVALYLYNCPEYLIAQYGAFKHSCVPVNVNYRYVGDELAYLLDDSDSRVLVYHRSLGERVAQVRDRFPELVLIEVDDGGTPMPGVERFAELVAATDPQPRRERSGDSLYMLYTGGTTGMPKGVMYQHHAFIQRQYGTFARLELPVPIPDSLGVVAEFAAYLHDLRPDITVPCCPLMHGTGMWGGVFPVHLTGGTVALLENRHFDADELLDTVERVRLTRLVIVGDAFARPILRSAQSRQATGTLPDLSSVERIVSAGAMWSAEMKDDMARLFPDALFVDALGSTEGGAYGRTESRAGSGAASTASFEVAPTTLLVTEDGTEIITEPGRPGLLASPTPARGYFKDPEKTSRTFREIEGNWYVITGDWATREADGSITLHGRGSNCINTGGEKVYPEEVEEAVKQHAAVDDCYVVGVPDDRFGQRVVAVASIRADGRRPASDELRAHLRTRLSGYKIPKQFVLVDELSRAPNGKADYGWARDTVLAATTARV